MGEVIARCEKRPEDDEARAFQPCCLAPGHGGDCLLWWQESARESGDMDAGDEWGLSVRRPADLENPVYQIETAGPLTTDEVAALIQYVEAAATKETSDA